VIERPPGSPEPGDEPAPAGAIHTPEAPRSEKRLTDSFAAGRGSGENPPAPDRGSFAALKELPVLVVLAFALALVLKTFVVQAFFIPSGSMEPTLLPGDRVLVNKVLYHPQRGDIIVFEDPHPGTQPDRGVVGGFVHWLSQGLGFALPADEDFIKRVIGMPGETLEIRDHAVLIDGKPLPEPYLTEEAKRSMGDYGPVTVPPDALFVMGDNRGDSDDSRASLGFIPLDKVIGHAFVMIWPPSRFGWLH
jgi:signal peptidase I